ncbi:hypothetical protein L3Q82_000023 [Scortum barcoo]|uniref:Uncharacterized protein n=1 Tax=Scortum barcoo TaxID=214431 RepID=A0ACB8X9E3_9TELE|nr:hypothetical protein L3Q82_000023 [Scortum barcoo]
MFWLWGRGASHPSLLPRPGEENAGSPGSGGRRKAPGSSGSGSGPAEDAGSPPRAREGQVEDAPGSSGSGGQVEDAGSSGSAMIVNENGNSLMEKTIDGGRETETENMVSSKNDNMEDDVSMENVFDERCVSINASKRKKSADKGQGGGKTRKTLQSLSDEEEEAELTVSQEERITSYSVEKIRRFLAETKGQRAVKTEQFFPDLNGFIGFFFSLERRNGQRKVIHCLRSDNGSLLTETTEIRRDYKVLSKALALRLREVMAEVVHVDQTYCVPGRLISDNIHLIRHVLDVSGSLGIGTGLISIDQEKAFDRVEHQYLWKTLAAFGFSPGGGRTGAGSPGQQVCSFPAAVYSEAAVYGPQDLVWRPLAQLTLRSIGGLGLQESVFLLDFKAVNLLSLPVFYRGLFSVWKLLRRQRVRHESLFWLLQEPMAHGGLMSAPSWVGAVAREGP